MVSYFYYPTISIFFVFFFYLPYLVTSLKYSFLNTSLPEGSKETKTCEILCIPIDIQVRCIQCQKYSVCHKVNRALQNNHVFQSTSMSEKLSFSIKNHSFSL